MSMSWAVHWITFPSIQNSMVTLYPQRRFPNLNFKIDFSKVEGEEIMTVWPLSLVALQSALAFPFSQITPSTVIFWQMPTTLEMQKFGSVGIEQCISTAFLNGFLYICEDLIQAKLFLILIKYLFYDQTQAVLRRVTLTNYGVFYRYALIHICLHRCLVSNNRKLSQILCSSDVKRGWSANIMSSFDIVHTLFYRRLLDIILTQQSVRLPKMKNNSRNSTIESDKTKVQDVEQDSKKCALCDNVQELLQTLLQKYLLSYNHMFKQDQARINLAVIGHVDSGKSTLIGHLMYKGGTIDKRTIAKLDKDAAQYGTPGYKYLWVMNDYGLGVIVQPYYRSFSTLKYHFTIADTPGHRDCMKNMITGTSQADCAILVIASPQQEFEAGMSIDGLTREHALLAFALGVKQMIVCCNKMDYKTVLYSEERYQQIKKEVYSFLTKVGYKTEAIPFIPISGWIGDNISQKSQKTPWYKGPTLFEALEMIAPPNRFTQKPLRLPIRDVYKITGIGTVVLGRVDTGVLKPGMSVTFAPSGLKGEVKSVEMYHSSISQGIPGDNVGCNVKGVLVKDIKRGHVCGETSNEPPKGAESFLAQVIVINHPGSIKNGYTPVIDCHTAHIACKFVQIQAKIDKKTGKVTQDNPKFIKNGDSAIILMKPTKPMCVETYAEYPTLGRFTVRDLKTIVAVGIIKAVYKKEQANQI